MTEAELDAAVREVLGRKRRPKRNIGGFRDWLAFLLVGSFIGTLPLLVFKDVPDVNKDTIVYILGQISGMALTVVGFYFVNKAGEDELAAKRADNTAAAFKAVEAAAQPNSQPQQVQVVNDPNQPVPVEETK